MTPQERVELAELLEEKMFRSEQGAKFERAKHANINGVEHTILRVKLKIRPPHMMAKMGQP